MLNKVVVVVFLLHTSIALDLGSECSCDPVEDSTETTTPSPTPTPSPSEETVSFAFDGSGGEGGACVCKRARKPTREVRCDKPGSDLDTEHPPVEHCKEVIVLDPVPGEPAVRLLVKIGVSPSSRLTVRDWYTVWTSTSLFTMSVSTRLDQEFMTLTDVTNHPLTFEMQLIVRDTDAAEIVVQNLNAAIDSKEFASEFEKQKYPQPAVFKVLSIRAFQIDKYDPAILHLWFNPLSNSQQPHFSRNVTHHHSNHTIRRVIKHYNHTNANGTTTVTEVVVDVPQEAPEESIVNKLVPVLKEEIPEASPLEIPSITSTDTRCGRPKKPSRLLVPPLARGKRSSTEFGQADSPDLIQDVPHVTEMGVVAPSPVNSPVYPESGFKEEIQQLRGNLESLNAKETELQGKIAALTWKMQHVQ
eukprot:c1998_g1_i1.p1 GENE.c1998_g1_i1~~c1998_g1_i1.p1  ORF type:complete len:415 (+),score=116.50 c1998_g1_i1:41-1285(+)